MQLKNIQLQIKVNFLSVNLLNDLENNELKLIFENFLGENLYLPEYQIKGETNGKQYEIKFVFDRPSTQVLALEVN